jgi:hypothetical protein
MHLVVTGCRLLLFSMEIKTLKKPVGQWDPCVAKSFRFFTEDHNVTCRMIYTASTTELAHNKLIQGGFQLNAMDCSSTWSCMYPGSKLSHVCLGMLDMYALVFLLSLPMSCSQLENASS